MSFWRFLYTLGWLLALPIVPLASLFHDKLRRWWQARRTPPPLPPPKRKVLWLHCASVGEFEQGRVIMEYLLTKLSQRPFLVVTFFSPSGWERYTSQTYPQADWIGPLPLDLPWVMRRWVRLLRPQAVFFVKYDLWPNLLHQLYVHNCPMYLLSAHVEPLHGLRWWWKKKLLRYMTHIFVQTQADWVKLSTAGFIQSTLTGDSRLIRVRQLAENWLPISGIQNWIGDKFCIIGGSVWEADVRFLAQAYEFLRGYSIRWILVPHEVSARQIEFIRRIWPVRCAQYTHESWDFADTLILDTTGMLGYLYAYGHVAWIGGGFGRGIHNILEAIIYRKPVFFGPNYKSFSEAHELIKLGVAESCRYPISFSNAVKSLVRDSRRLRIIAQRVEQYLESKPDTIQLIWEKLATAPWLQTEANPAPENLKTSHRSPEGA
ncbi:MAG: hypothetical protein NZ958_07880 [Bacteroidia bacterium]|nr:hypothetical protein [Bacteroidia bacterium]MDW8088598.1 glycosyltransferase N-terminal domain-containing protein [Bacteroidia bacterium]